MFGTNRTTARNEEIQDPGQVLEFKGSKTRLVEFNSEKEPCQDLKRGPLKPDPRYETYSSHCTC